jgi:hypothetical protein
MKYRGCPWCHAMNPESVDWCKECGHRAHRPRSDCDCVGCRIKNDVQSGLEAFRAGPDAWAEWNAAMLDLEDEDEGGIDP